MSLLSVSPILDLGIQLLFTRVWCTSLEVGMGPRPLTISMPMIWRKMYGFNSQEWKAAWKGATVTQLAQLKTQCLSLEVLTKIKNGSTISTSSILTIKLGQELMLMVVLQVHGHFTNLWCLKGSCTYLEVLMEWKEMIFTEYSLMKMRKRRMFKIMKWGNLLDHSHWLIRAWTTLEANPLMVKYNKPITSTHKVSIIQIWLSARI